MCCFFLSQRDKAYGVFCSDEEVACLLTGQCGRQRSYMLALAAVPLLLWQPILCHWCSAPLICVGTPGRRGQVVHGWQLCIMVLSAQWWALLIMASFLLVFLHPSSAWGLQAGVGRLFQRQQLGLMVHSARGWALWSLAAPWVLLHPSSACRLQAGVGGLVNCSSCVSWCFLHCGVHY
jgi:hypothetical protein